MATKKTKKAASVRGAATAPAKKSASAARGRVAKKKAAVKKPVRATRGGGVKKGAKASAAKKASAKANVAKKTASTQRAAAAKSARGTSAAASKGRSARRASAAAPSPKRGATAPSSASGATKRGLAKARPATRPSTGAQPPRVVRRDGAGHLDPKYAEALMAESGLRTQEQDPDAFIEKPRASDDLAENFGEEFVASATSGENQEEELLEQQVPEERGGPFVETAGGTEFADGTDASNPEDAEREPFPTT